MDSIKEIIAAVLERHGPIENRNLLCADLVDALTARGAPPEGDAYDYETVQQAYYYRHLTTCAKGQGFDGITSALSALSDLRNTQEIGRLADVVDNLISAEALPIPENLAKEARCGALTTLRDQMRQFHVDVTGENPWEGQWP